jgi:hypothetical protein
MDAVSIASSWASFLRISASILELEGAAVANIDGCLDYYESERRNGETEDWSTSVRRSFVRNYLIQAGILLARRKPLQIEVPGSFHFI